MAVTIKHAKHDTIADWTQSDLDAQISAGNYPPGTLLADIVLPSDWNNDHTVTGLGTMATQDASSVSITGGSISGATVSGYIPTTQKGAANGVATLDSGGQVPLAQIPPLGDLNYQGTWNASTNTPTLTSSVGTKGYYYVVNVAGSTNLNGITDWQVGDWAVYNGSAWQKIDNTDAVTSVNGKTGTVVLTYTDVGAQPAGTYVNNITSTDGSVTVTGTTTVDLSVATAASTQNVLCQIRNTTGATLTKGTVVYISGATGQIPTVSKAIATGDATSAQTLGMMTADLANNSNGYVTIIGLINDIDTSAYTDGQQLYLSGTTAGTVTGTKPSAPTHLVYVAVVEYAHPIHGKLFVKVQNGYELNEIHDVQITSPANGQTILYDASTSLWKNANLTAGTGISISNGAASATITNSAPDQTVAITGTSPVSVTGTYPNFTASMTQSNTSTNGWLSSTDWNTFNNKGSGTVTSVTAVAPVVSSGGTTPIISMAAATSLVSGYLTSTDWSTFNSKQAALVSGTNIKTVNSTSLLGSGDVSVGVLTVTGTAPVVSSGGANPAISMAAATGSVSGYLTSTDWTTFNSKGSGSVTSVSVVSANGFAGTVATSTTTPAITLTTSITGMLKGNGTAISAGTAGTDYVAPATATNFTAQQYFGNVALTDAATISWAANTAQVATFTFVSSNRTMGAPTGLVNGAFYALNVIQNAGSNTLTWNAVFKWTGGTAPTLSTGASAKDFFVFRSDGTNLYEQGRSLNVS